MIKCTIYRFFKNYSMISSKVLFFCLGFMLKFLILTSICCRFSLTNLIKNYHICSLNSNERQLNNISLAQRNDLKLEITSLDFTVRRLLRRKFLFIYFVIRPLV